MLALMQRGGIGIGIAIVGLLGCAGASSAPPERPSAAIEAAIAEGVEHAWGCEEPAAIAPPAPEIRDLCDDEVGPRRDPIARERATAVGGAPCLRWREDSIPTPDGEWSVSACGQTEHFVCLGPCAGREMVCLPTSSAPPSDLYCGTRR